MRKRLHSEEENFGAFKKSSNIKFPLKVGSFIFKSKGALVFIEKLLAIMEFKNEPKINYDPHHVISLRKQANKNKPFDHQSIEGLAETTNLLQFRETPRSDGDTSSIVIKRSLSEVESMELDEDGSHKKANLSHGGGISNEDISDDFKKVSLVPTKAVQINQFSFKSVDGSESSSTFKSKE